MLFHQVGDDLSIRFSDELVAFLFELALQLDVIFHNAVMDNHDLAGAVAVRMRVLFGRAPVRGPARVSDAVRAFNRRLPDGLLEVVQFARSAADFHLAVRSDDGYASGIIAAIFEAPQTVEDERNNFF